MTAPLQHGTPLLVDGKPATFLEYSTDIDEPYMVYADVAGVERWMFATAWRVRAELLPSATLVPSDDVLTIAIDRDKVTAP